MPKYLVVSKDETQYLAFGDGACYGDRIANLLRYPCTDRLDEALRQMTFATRELAGPKIVKVSLVLEDVSMADIHKEQDRQAASVFSKLSESEQKLLVRYVKQNF